MVSFGIVAICYFISDITGISATSFSKDCWILNFYLWPSSTSLLEYSTFSDKIFALLSASFN